jgi:hypothetical protein
MANIKAIAASILMLVVAPFFGAGLAFAETNEGSAAAASQVKINGNEAGMQFTNLGDSVYHFRTPSGEEGFVLPQEWSREKYSLASATKVAETDSVEVRLSRADRDRGVSFRTTDARWLNVLKTQPIYMDRVQVRKGNVVERRTFYTFVVSADAPDYREYNVGWKWPAVAAAKSQQKAFTGKAPTVSSLQGKKGGVVLKVEENSQAKAVRAIANGVKSGKIFIGKAKK